MSNIDISHPLIPTFTNGFDFYEAIIQHVKKRQPSLIRISSYNTSVNEEFTPLVDQYIASLCRYCKEVQLLIGINPHHPFNDKIFTILKKWESIFPNLKSARLRGVHMKATLITPSTGFAGSLNLIHPTLDDLMVQLSTTQYREVDAYFTRLWNKSAK